VSPKDVLERRLKRLAEGLRFRHYAVCPRCSAPIVVFPEQLASPPSHLRCGDCGDFIPFDQAGIREYTPDA
jgi:hypothetical protein